jgi:hypothetical protein
MILVPLNGDTVETEAGLPQKVVAYSNLNSSGPLVRVQSKGSELKAVSFKSIFKINDLEVTLLKNDKGQNVFSTDGYLKRAEPLPQVNEVLHSNVNGIENRKYTVKRVRLHVKGRLSEGLIFECTDEDGTPADLRVRDIIGIESYLFNRKAFQKLYFDYAGTESST